MGRTSDAKDRLLESGSELMHERGYTAVGVSEVCSRAGVNKGSFYYFFPSKLELALAVVDGFHAETRAPLDELADGSGAPLERLAGFLEQLYRVHEAKRQSCGKVLGCPIGNLALEMSTQEPQLRDRLQEVFDRNVECFENVLQEAVDREDVPPLDTRRAARSILALMEGSVMLAKMQDDPEVLRDIGPDVLRLIGAGSRQDE